LKYPARLVLLHQNHESESETVKSGGDITLFSRRKKLLNREFPYIVESLAALPEGTVVDGEISQPRRQRATRFQSAPEFPKPHILHLEWTQESKMNSFGSRKPIALSLYSPS
jgi:hypothetical protein